MMFRIWVSLVLLLAVAGCGKELPTTVPVTGTVTWQDKPLDSGRVVFHPQQIEKGRPKRPAMGYLQTDGSFALATFRPDDGAVPGSYQVTIHSYLKKPVSNNDDINPPEDVWRIPERYGDPERSGLTATVSSDEKVELSFVIEEP